MSEQLDLFDMAQENKSAEAALSAKFGCCHLYRECSDQKHCLQPADYSKDCIYFSNLNSGKIFYGKNSHLFDAERYKALESYYFSLSAPEKAVFRDFVIFAEVKNLGRNSFFMLKNEEAFSVLKKCPSLICAEPHSLLVKLFSLEIITLRSACKLFIVYVKNPPFKAECKLSFFPTLKNFFFTNDNELSALLQEIDREFMLFTIPFNDITLTEFFHSYIKPEMPRASTSTEFILFDSEKEKPFKERIQKIIKRGENL